MTGVRLRIWLFIAIIPKSTAQKKVDQMKDDLLEAILDGRNARFGNAEG